jgi:hypothetical protein
MTKHHVPIDNQGYNGLISIQPLPGINKSNILFSVICGDYDVPKQIALHVTKKEAVQLANALHSLVVEIDREESKKDD